jgi:hypothetical protein
VVFPIGDREGDRQGRVRLRVGRRAARPTVLFNGQITGKGKDEGQTSLTLPVKTGRLTYDLGKKRPRRS